MAIGFILFAFGMLIILGWIAVKLDEATGFLKDLLDFLRSN
jgi:hypothetical protein